MSIRSSRIRSASAARSLAAAVLAGGTGVVAAGAGEERFHVLWMDPNWESDDQASRRRDEAGKKVRTPSTMFASGSVAWTSFPLNSLSHVVAGGGASLKVGRAVAAPAKTLCEGEASSKASETGTPNRLQPSQHQVFTDSLHHVPRMSSSASRALRASKPEQGGSSDDAARQQPALSSNMNNKDTSVEAVKDEKDTLCADSEGGDAYPNFSRHGKFALLPVYLTPQVYEALRRKRTPSGVTIEDCIQAGVALPHGARPPRGLAGVYAGDADSYRTFSDLFVPLLQDYHQSTDQRHNVRRRQQNQDQQQQPVSGGGAGLLNDPDPTTALTAKQMQGRSRSSTASVGRLQRHQTNLNYSYLVKDTLDPEGEYILYTRMRLARSVAGFRFPPCIRRGERRQVEQLLKDVVMDWPGRYVSVMDMSNSQHDHLIQQQLLFKDPDEYLLTAGFGRDWPDARGIYCDTWHDTPNIIIWCNAEDHLWIISHGKGGNVQGVFTELSKAVGALEAALKARGRGFVEDDKYGFLNASPANIGTALRASVYVKLVRLSRQPGFFDLVAKLRLEARSDYSQTDRRFTGIYDIANAEALGKSEVDLINIMIRGVGFLIELEKKLERGEAVDLDSVELPAS